jgi:hypothetical protein
MPVQEISCILHEIQLKIELFWGVGFFGQVVNHGFPTALMDEILRVYKLFFELPLEEKIKYYTTDPHPTFRFGVGRITPSPSVQNWKDFAIVRPGRDLDKLPAHPPTFRYLEILLKSFELQLYPAFCSDKKKTFHWTLSWNSFLRNLFKVDSLCRL